MKKNYTMNVIALFPYIIIVLSILYCTSLVVSNCQSLYYRSSRALLMRSKYRLCARLLRTQNREQEHFGDESSCVPLHCCDMYVKESMISSTEHNGHDDMSLHFECNDGQDQLSLEQSELLSSSIKASFSVPIPPDTNMRTNIRTHLLSKPFAWPLKKGSFWVSSFFGPRKRPDGSAGFHTGIDLAAIKGTPVYAPRSGLIVQAYHTTGYGKTIVIQHGKKFKTRYAHLDKIHVAPGDWVRKNRKIGEVGDTGFIRKEGKDGSHLHFEVYEYEKRVNPMQFLPKLV